MKACAPRPRPIVHPPPRLPGKTENLYEGRATVDLQIGIDGKVERVTWKLATWTPRGRGNAEPLGYREAIVSALSQWRYAPRATPCVVRQVVTIALDDTP